MLNKAQDVFAKYEGACPCISNKKEFPPKQSEVQGGMHLHNSWYIKHSDLN